ncbi:hypothetical protein BDV93DRAFT_606424 [Ceratobasidium sp. AG-I]|nr:hypothetical protein BDV93DRAFT_606424 [Ceratobasidium sp. AG-I]
MGDHQLANATATRANNAHWTNRLPIELLSRVFILGEGMQRGPRAFFNPYVGFQDLATQVCHHWREVAIHTPALWSYIFISRPPPHRCAELYLARSGPTRLLDIDLEMKMPYIDGISPFDRRPQEVRALETLQSIVAHGGQIARWRSLIVIAKAAGVMFKTVSFINFEPTPELQFLSLTWKANFAAVDIQEVIALEEAPEVLNEIYALDSGPRRPQLRSVEFGGLPKAFVFERTSPLVSNLTYLKLCPAFLLPSIQDIGTLLSASPRLESLHIDVMYVGEELFEPVLVQSQVLLPLLRSFTLRALTYNNWCMSLLQSIDAPAVEYFRLEGIVEYLSSGLLLFYLGVGRTNGVLERGSAPGDRASRGPIFPSLHHLDLALSFNLAKGSKEQTSVLQLLSLYPMITQVTLSHPVLLALSILPTLCPNVSHFRYHDYRNSSFLGIMKRILLAREKAGMQIPLLEIVIIRNRRDEAGNADTELDYVTPLGKLVGKLDIKGEESLWVHDSDEDIVFSEEETSTKEEDMVVSDEDVPAE